MKGKSMTYSRDSEKLHDCNLFFFVLNNPMKYTDPTGYIPYEFKLDAYFNWMDNRDINYAHDGVYYGDGFYNHVGYGKLYSMMGGKLSGSYSVFITKNTTMDLVKAGLIGYEGGELVPGDVMTSFQMRISDTRDRPSTETYNNANSYYPYSNGSYMGRMYASNGEGWGLPNPFKVAKAAYDWRSSLKYISNYANLLNFNKPQRNAFRHIFGDLYLYSKGYSVDVINRVQNIHELTSINGKDKDVDLANNALVDRYIVLNGDISSTSTYNIAKISLSIMTFYGFYIPNEGSPKKENFTFNQFQEFLKIIK